MSVTQMSSYSTLEREPCMVASSSQGNRVQVPALGKFSYSDLCWSNHKNVEIAFIPSNRLNDYIAGEENRCSCTFTNSNVVNYLRSPSRNRTVAFKASYNCCYGIEFFRAHICQITIITLMTLQICLDILQFYIYVCLVFVPGYCVQSDHYFRSPLHGCVGKKHSSSLLHFQYVDFT